jgi:GNAT superfamily N-acetyltransferase
MKVRRAVERDFSQLLLLMRQLAEFENYADEFVITEEILRDQGFRRSPPDFYCVVAEENGKIIAFLVYYLIPYTYRAKPNMVIKELYVAEGFRSKAVGTLLMRAAAEEAVRAGCGRIKWWVAKWNKQGIEFYERLGARIDPDWHEFQMPEEAFRKPAER